jgi:putative hydrolase of the HAD superfamily
MIAPHMPLPLKTNMVWWEPRMRPWLATEGPDTRRRRRARGGLIVDLDDTLYEREHFVTSGFAAVAHYASRTYGVSRDAAFATLSTAHADGPGGQEFQALCRSEHLPLSIVGDLVRIFREHRPSLWLSPGVEETLESLRRDGWRIAVLTNGLPSVQASKIAALDLARHVDHILYAENFATGGKPAITAFQAALIRLGLAAESCVCVGDDAVCDIDGAHRVGIRTIHLVPAGASAHSKADAVIHTFEELPAIAASLIPLVTIDVA